MSLVNSEYTIFSGIFPSPPVQGRVGRPVRNYLVHISPRGPTGWTLPPFATLHRAEVREICRDHTIPVLEAYAICMAWGGKRWDHFCSSVAGASQANLEKLLNDLRVSTCTRAEDFKRAKLAAVGVKGLGISFYTKLLFFFRPEPDAYILDQWTAKSIIKLINPGPVRLKNGLPADNTTEEEYEAYCKAIEELATALSSSENSWTAEDVETGLFDRPRSRWRLHLGDPAEEDVGERSPEDEEDVQNIKPDSKPVIYLYAGQEHDRALALRNQCEAKRNDGWICRAHNVLSLKINGRSPRYLIGEIAASGGNFRMEPGYVPSTNEKTHCMGGCGYEGHLDFASLEEAVGYLKQYFDIKACPCNTTEDQGWIDNC